MSPVDSPSPHDTGFGSVAPDRLRAVAPSRAGPRCATPVSSQTLEFARHWSPFPSAERRSLAWKRRRCAWSYWKSYTGVAAPPVGPTEPRGPRTVLWGHEKVQLQRQPHLSPPHCSLRFHHLQSGRIDSGTPQTPLRRPCHAWGRSGEKSPAFMPWDLLNIWPPGRFSGHCGHLCPDVQEQGHQQSPAGDTEVAPPRPQPSGPHWGDGSDRTLIVTCKAVLLSLFGVFYCYKFLTC